MRYNIFKKSVSLFSTVHIRFLLLHAACSASAAQVLVKKSIHKPHTDGGPWGKANGLSGLAAQSEELTGKRALFGGAEAHRLEFPVG